MDSMVRTTQNVSVLPSLEADSFKAAKCENICWGHTCNSIPWVYPPQCSPECVRFLKVFSRVPVNSYPFFCFGRIITMKHGKNRISFFSIFLTLIIETKTTTWGHLEGQILAHSLIDAFKLSSCQVSSASIFTQSLQILTINKHAKRDVDSCLPVWPRECSKSCSVSLSLHASIPRIKEAGKKITGC